MMEADIRRIVRREFPELASGYHLPMLARIESISDLPADVAVADAFRPYWAADVQLLGRDRKPVPGLPAFKNVPLPVPGGGLERGDYMPPMPGTICEVAFAYGQPDQLFIRQVLGWSLSVPALETGGEIRQQSPGVADKTDSNGNKSRITHGDITDQANTILQQAVSLLQTATRHHLTSGGHSTETIGGIKLVEALGAIKLLSGGICNISAIDNINLTTTRDQNSNASGSINANAGGSIQQVAAGLARLQGATLNIGNGTDNLLQIISDLIDIVAALADATAQHVHTAYGTSVPTNSATITQAKTDADTLAADKLQPMIP